MEKPLKILMVNFEFPPLGGGGGQAHANLLKEFAGIPNLDVDVLTASATKQFRYDQFAPNIGLHRLGISKKDLHYWRKTEIIEWLFKARRYYQKLIEKNSYDLVHAFFAFPSGLLCLKTAGQIPYLVSLRGSDVPGFNMRLKLDYILLKGLFRRIWRNADAVIANSQGLAELAGKFEPNLKIGVICNGINTHEFVPPSSGRDLSGRIKLLTVCRLIERKRIHLLIEAVRHLTEQAFDVELNIVGEGNLLGELQALAERLNITDRIHFQGLIDHEKMPPVYQQNHLFLISSAHEGMSNAMLEAMASGLPIVSTACEGTDELIAENGVVVNNPCAEQIAQAITKTCQDPLVYPRMSEASRQKALSFSWASTATQYIHIYQHISERHACPDKNRR